MPGTKYLVAATESVGRLQAFYRKKGPLQAKTVYKGFRKKAEFEVGFLVQIGLRQLQKKQEAYFSVESGISMTSVLRCF